MSCSPCRNGIHTARGRRSTAYPWRAQYDALARHVAFQLGKDEDDLEHGLAHRRGRIELLVLADERHAELLAPRVHRREIQQIAADAVDLPDQHMRELAGLDALQHRLERRAIGILAGIPGILEHLILLDTEDVLRVVYHILPLHWQGIPVHLMERGHAAVNRRLLCSWHRAASSRRLADVSMLIVAAPRAAARTPMRASRRHKRKIMHLVILLACINTCYNIPVRGER